MKLILLTPGESRRGWMTLGKGSSLLERDAPVSKNNRCIESSHRHGGVREVGMLRSVIEKSREILTGAKKSKKIEATRITSCKHSKGVLVSEEVGVARSSEDASVMERGGGEYKQSALFRENYSH